MRLFDVAGIVFVAAWLITLGAFMTIGQDSEQSSGIPLVGGDIELHEETVWMTVYREGEEVGVLREDRTLLIDGWLIETQGIVELNLLDDNYLFNFVSRSTLNEDLTLRSAIGEVKAFGMELSMNGRVHNTDDTPELHVNINLDGSSQQFVADLDDVPRLATHAIPQMLANDELEKGVRFQQEFFDPLTLSPSTLELVYEGRDEITNVDGHYPDAHAFRQSVGTFVSEIRADSRGMIIQQTLPMQIAIARLPEALGRNQFSDYFEAFEEASDKSPPFINAIDTDDLMALVSRFGSGQIDRLRPAGEGEAILEDEIDEESNEFLISPLPDPEYRALMSPQQRIAIQTTDEARVEVGPVNALWHAGLAPENSSYDAVMSAEEHDGIAALSSVLSQQVDAGDFDPEAALAEIDRQCPHDWLEQGFPDLDEPWPIELGDEPSSPLECLAIVADALSASDLPPHFVHGAYIDGDEPSARVWIALYHDGEFLGALDLFAPNGAVSSRHVQLFIDDTYNAEALGEWVGAISVD